VSRRSFRARVAAPRPASAWLLVTVASATLWITQQLDPWATSLQAAALLVSLWRRERPFAWQQSGMVLNLGMLGIVAATISVALRGEPTTIALAYFALLTQGLQLLDARPRPTEFLLVTLTLFQVVLASNLTDSVFFPPLLAAFAYATIWTLLIHTLRSEAIEAGDPQGVSRAITPGLLHTTLVASTLSVLLALLLFVTLPRLRTSVVRGVAGGPDRMVSGFSDRVALGALGRIRLDAGVVLRIETLEGTPPPPGAGYWRGLAFDRFDGTSWSITPPDRLHVAGSAEGGVAFGRHPEEIDLVQRVVREPAEAGVLFRAGDARELHGTVRRLQRDTSGGLYAAGQDDERVRYTIATRRANWGETALRRDVAEPDPHWPERDLQLPELSPAVAELARSIAAGLDTDAERVRAVETHLLRHGRYSDVPPTLDPASERSPIEAFLLGSLSGHCEYFASSMVVLLRSLGIPARLVNGFAGGQPNPIGDFVELKRSDAHTWVEVRYARAGWVRYDPTPADLRARPPAPPSASERLRQLASAVELWWFQRVVGFDRSDQIHALKRAWLAWRGAFGSDSPRRRHPGQRVAAADWGAFLHRAGPWSALLLLAGLGLVRRRRRGRAAARLPAGYARALRLLARRGLVRAPATTAREFARTVRAQQPVMVAQAFDALTEDYLAERFGRRAPPAGARHLAVLERGLEPRRGGLRRRSAVRS